MKYANKTREVEVGDHKIEMFELTIHETVRQLTTEQLQRFLGGAMLVHAATGDYLGKGIRVIEVQEEGEEDKSPFLHVEMEQLLKATEVGDEWDEIPADPYDVTLVGCGVEEDDDRLVFVSDLLNERITLVPIE